MKHRSSAVPLAWGYVGLVGYASLYPFAGWRSTGVSPLDFVGLPLMRWWNTFDVVANVIGYLPLGMLAFIGMVRAGHAAWRAALAALAIGGGLSFAMEFLQNFLPMRVPSNLDLLTNLGGTALGALLGWGLHLVGMVDRWHGLRERWFIPASAGGLALLAIWPLGLLFPAPVPLGLGHVTGRLVEGLASLVDGSLLAPWFEPWLARAAAEQPLQAGAEWGVTMLGLLAPCLVAFAISRPGWRRLVLALGAALIGFAATTLSTALNFGPDHALAWRTPVAESAFGSAVVLAGLLALLPMRLAPLLGLMVLTGLVVLVAQAPADPYFAQSLHDWERGRFIRFHGAAQWLGWLWPYLAMTYLLVRAGRGAPQT